MMSFLLVLTCLPVVPVPSWMKITRNTPNKAGFADLQNDEIVLSVDAIMCFIVLGFIQKYTNIGMTHYRY